MNEREHAEHLLTIQRDLGAVLSGISALEPAVEAVLDAMLRFEGFDSGGVYVVDPTTGNLELLATRGLSEWFVESVRTFRPESRHAALIRAGAPLYRVYADVARELTPGSIDDPDIREGLKAIAVVPVQHQGEVIGCLNAASHTTLGIPEPSRRALESIAYRIGMAIARIRTEADLRGSEEQLRVVYENTFDGILLARIDTRRFHSANRTAGAMLGYELDELCELAVDDIHPPESLEHVRGHFERQAASGGYVAPDIPVRRKDGSVFYADISSRPVKLRGVDYLIGIFRDATERRHQQADALKAQRLESIGLLAASIAHDFNNALMSIGGNIALARMRASADPQLGAWLEAAEQAALGARELPRRLLTFSKGGAPVRRSHALADLMREPVERAMRGSRCELDLALPADLWPLRVDGDQIAQLLQHLVQNAVGAMRGAGTVRIGAENLLVGPHDGAALRPGRYVRLSVSDTGCGIAPEHLGHVFDPYFTTHELGAGLGLAVCYSVATRHDGRIDIASELGVGSTFTVTLPAAERVTTKPPRAAPTEPGGRRRVLVMDDDPAVARVVTAMLETLGYAVATARDGDEAVLLFRQAKATGPDFDVVILDLTVHGGPGGLAAAGALRTIDPGVKLVVSSGYSSDPAIAEPARFGFQAVLKKPFRTKQLQDMLERLLGEEAAGRA